jgi:hypothetical protein
MNIELSAPSDWRSSAFTSASHPSEATRSGMSRPHAATPASANAYAKMGCLIRFA